MKRSKVYSISDHEFIKLVEKSKAYVDILRSLGLSTKGGNSSKTLKRRIAELNIDISHFEKEYERAQSKTRTDMSLILVENSTYLNIARLKLRLVKEGYLKYECAICNNDGLWNGKPLSLQLDHINGINNDHRIENLRFLCPNCHAQTDTFSGRNNKNRGVA